MTPADRLIRDPWFQAFLVLSLMGSAGACYSAFAGGGGGSPAPVTGAAVPLAPPAAQGSVPAGDARTAYPIPAPVGVIAVVVKTSGTWIVDSRPSADRDTDSVADAARRSSPGDLILIRPGHYSGMVELEHDLTLRGQPTMLEPVVLEWSGDDVVEQRWGNSRIENLEIAGRALGKDGADGINLSAGTLALSRVRVSMEGGAGAFSYGGLLQVEDSTFTASRVGLLVASKLVCERCVLFHNESGIRVMEQASGVRVARSLFKENSLGLSARAAVALTDTRFASNNRGIQLWFGKSTLTRVTAEGSRSHNMILQEKGEAVVTDSDFLGGGSGITLWDDTKLDLKDSRVRANRDAGLQASGHSRAKINGCDFAGNPGLPYIFEQSARWEGGKNTPALPKRKR